MITLPVTLPRIDKVNWKIVKNDRKRRKLFIINEVTDLVNNWLKRQVAKIEGGDNAILDEKKLEPNTVSEPGAGHTPSGGYNSRGNML